MIPSLKRPSSSPAAFLLPLLFPAVALSGQEPPVVRGDLGQRLDSVASAAQAKGFHGNVLVAQGGQVILLKGYGIAIQANSAPAGTPTIQPSPASSSLSPMQASAVPFGPSTVVQIGSNVKDITKVAILQLVEAGQLGLDDSLARFFPAVPPDKRGITVGQLLDHRAGFPLGVGPDEEALSRAAFLARLFARPLDFKPGTARQYSNAGYSVLAAMIEQLTGQSYEAAVAQSIFRRAGMYETGLLLPGFKPERLAHCYDGDRDRGTMLDKPRDAEGHYWNLRGNGGFVATLGDMHRFYQGLRGAALLSDSAHRAMVLRPDEPSMLAGSDGYCFFLLGNFPRAGVEIMVASNHAGFKAPVLMDALTAAAGIEVRGGGGRREVAGGPPGSGGLAGGGTGGPGGTRAPGGTGGRGAIGGAGAGPGSKALPATGVGQTVAAYLEAFNSGDSAQVRRFFETRAMSGPQSPPAAARVSRTLQMRADLGRLTVESVRELTVGLELVVSAERGERATLTFDVEPVAPFRMRGLRVEVGGS